MVFEIRNYFTMALSCWGFPGSSWVFALQPVIHVARHTRCGLRRVRYTPGSFLGAIYGPSGTFQQAFMAYAPLLHFTVLSRLLVWKSNNILMIS